MSNNEEPDSGRSDFGRSFVSSLCAGNCHQFDCGGTPSRTNRRGGEEDVLSTNYSSRGLIKEKHVDGTYQLSRAPSTVSMRQMILNGGSTPASAKVGGIAAFSAPSNAPGASSSAPRGLSMHIEMDLSSSSANQSTNAASASSKGNSATPDRSNSSLSSSFSRSASISSMTNIEEKVRRGLKKRIARSWITWAESWCMRHWMEEGEGKGIRRKLGSGGGIGQANDGNYIKRAKKNVRPTVRRIGAPPAVKVRPAPRVKNVWKPLTPEGNQNGRTERWISTEKEDEVGVEVVCTIPDKTPAPPTTSPRDIKDVDLLNEQQPQEESGSSNGNKQSTMKIRLLKSLSNAT